VSGKDADEVLGMLKEKMDYKYPVLKKQADQNVVVAA
jgi:hypothetical protein